MRGKERPKPRCVVRNAVRGNGNVQQTCRFVSPRRKADVGVYGWWRRHKGSGQHPQASSRRRTTFSGGVVGLRKTFSRVRVSGACPKGSLWGRASSVQDGGTTQVYKEGPSEAHVSPRAPPRCHLQGDRCGVRGHGQARCQREPPSRARGDDEGRDRRAPVLQLGVLRADLS